MRRSHSQSKSAEPAPAMIAIISNVSGEAKLLQSLCDFRKWPCQVSETLEQFQTLCERATPKVLVMRHRLKEGYSDDIFAYLEATSFPPPARIIVLMSGDVPPHAEARQIALGADCVLRDPLRIEVLMEYLARFRRLGAQSASVKKPAPASYEIAGVTVLPQERKIAIGSRTFRVAPQEIALVRLFAHANQEVISYPTLYSELFGRRFDGVTTNCRVLLGKVTASFRRLGVDLRNHIEVIPKSGYRYRRGSAPESPAQKSAPKKHPRR